MLYTCGILVFSYLLLFYPDYLCRASRVDSYSEFPNQYRNDTNLLLSIFDYGATGDGLTDDSKAFIKAWKSACPHSGRSTIVIPRGFAFLLHPVDFAGPCKAEITLHISGSITAPESPTVWETLNPRKWVYFHGVENLEIKGGGRIDGKGSLWWAQSCKFNQTTACRKAPTAFTFHKCTHLKLTRIEFINSQQMHVSFTNCLHVTASQLFISAPEYAPNTDGVHVSSSQHVTISDAFVRTGDDCVSIVGNSSRIRIHNFTCLFGHGISIGSLGESEAAEIVHDVVVKGAFLWRTSNGLRIKTWQGGNGDVGEVKFEGVRMKNVSHPIVIEQYYCGSTGFCRNESGCVGIGNISYVDIRGSSGKSEAVRFACSDAKPCENIYMKDVELVGLRGPAKSFCWQAHGTAHGVVSPSPCFSHLQTNNSFPHLLQTQ